MNKLIFAFRASLIIAISFIGICNDCSAQVWTIKDTIPDATITGRWGAYCFSIGNKIYAGGGYIGNFINKHDLWEYDVASDSWTQRLSLPGSTSRTAAIAFSINGKGYVGLGQQNFNTASSIFLSDLWEYDPILNTWTAKASIPDSARSNASCFQVNNQEYIVGGITSYPTTASNDLWMYDPSSNQWTSKQPFPADYIYSSMSFAVGNNGYTVGGRVKLSGAIATSKATWQYNPSNNNWTAKADYCDTLGRESGVAFVLNNKAYVGLGMSKINTTTYYFKEFCVYDTLINSWSPSLSFVGIDRAYSIAATANNKAYVGAGFLYNGSQNYYKDWWEFSLPTGVSDLQNEETSISIFPNPASENINIVLSNKETLSFKIVNTLGETIQSGFLSSTNKSLDISTISNGIYSIILFNNNHLESKLFIKN